IASKTLVASTSWIQGHPAVPCPVTADPAAVYMHADGAGNFPATLSTAPIGTTNPVYRAVLETTCAAVHVGDTVAGTISAAGEEACCSLSGAGGDAMRVSAVATSGSLVPVPEVRGPDGAAFCDGGSGSVDCTLGATGLQTIVVRDSGGTATGGYDLSVACLPPSCPVIPPPLTIAMPGAVTQARFTRQLAYTL